MKNNLATEEMTACPKCGAMTFAVGPCFGCSSKNTQTPASRDKIVEAARAFVHEAENWEGYKEMLTSNSAAIPPEWMALCEAVEDVFGAPKVEDAV